MSKIVWDKVDERIYETGVSKGVLYPYNTKTKKYDKGVAWNGLTGVTESPSGAESTPMYADNIKYLNLMSAEDFGATVEAYTYPDEFAACNGEIQAAKGLTVGQQTRSMFGMSYQTKVGSEETEDLGYKIHLVYGAKAAPSEKAYSTVNDSPEAVTFSWEISTTPVEIEKMKPTAILTIDSRKADATKLAELEKKLYGDTETEAELPMPADVIKILGEVDEG